MKLDVDLRNGVVPISKAASSLAALLKRTRQTGQPIIVTQKGYPTGVMVDIETYSRLRALVDQVGIENLPAAEDLSKGE